MWSRAILAFALLSGLSLASAQEDAGDKTDGLALARKTCAACHNVDPSDSGRAGLSAASFYEIANTPGMSAMALTVWLRSPHRDMPHLQLSDKQVKDVTAYIVSLHEAKHQR